MDKPLHPNLARIAAEYDHVVLAFQQGHITPPEARRRILALVARDDTGIEWSLDPDSGQWRYRNKWGHYEIGTPPAWGMSSMTPQQFGSGQQSAVDDRLTMHEVDINLIVAPDGLAGSTLATRKQPRPSARIPSRAIAGAVLIALAGTVVIAAITR